MAAHGDKARSLLEEGERLVAEIHALEGEPAPGLRLLTLYLRLEDVVARVRALQEEAPS
ncbi:hypothetical protein [Halomonas sp. HG01]|uniref:hypothetical protein n=1 Tax=Halomonas sp. HG01 TaxID=1609967 RepID=UPI000A7C72FB|nr:hypothetical protein [Halomonas sp. HG01]